MSSLVNEILGIVPSCEKCRWEKEESCYYDPPTTQLVPRQGLQGIEMQIMVIRPKVRATDFCSKFTLR